MTVVLLPPGVTVENRSSYNTGDTANEASRGPFSVVSLAPYALMYGSGYSLVTTTGKYPGESLAIAGHAHEGDGGGGTFFWDDDTTTPDNRGTVVVSGASPRTGCWKRVYDGQWDAAWFGAVGDGVTDATPGFVNLINALGTSAREVVIPTGTYLVGLDLVIPSSASVHAQPGASFTGAGSVTFTVGVLAGAFPIPDVATLRATSPIAGYLYQLLGYRTNGDGGQGDFRWDAASTDADDGGTIFKVGSIAAGRWKRVYTGAINVKWFGAYGNHAADDYAAIQAAITVAALSTGPTDLNDPRTMGNEVHIPKGWYNISQGLVIPESANFTLSGESTPGGFYLNTTIQWAGLESTGWMIDAQSAIGFSFRDMKLVGQTDVLVETSPCCQNGVITGRVGFSHWYGSFNNWENITIWRFSGTGVQFGRFPGDDIFLRDDYQTDNSLFRNLVVQDCKIGIRIQSPNFLQCLFDKLSVANYGGDTGVFAKFTTETAVHVKFGAFVATACYLYAAAYDVTRPWTQYAIYCEHGTFNILSGYTEALYLAYVKDSDLATVQPNSISDFLMNQGAAGGSTHPARYIVYYAQSRVPLVLKGCYCVNVFEAATSCGVHAFGCQSQQPCVSTTDYSLYTRNPKSSEICCTYLVTDGLGGSWQTNSSQVGADMGLFSAAAGEMMLSTNLVARNYPNANSPAYLFLPRTTGNTHCQAWLIDSDGMSLIQATLTPFGVYSLAYLKTFTVFRIGLDGKIHPLSGGVGLTIPTAAALRLASPMDTAASYYLQGYRTTGDGGEGTFRWDAASTATDDGGTVFKVGSVTTGRWIRVYEGAVNVKWFGAYGDNSHDDTAAIKAANVAAWKANIGTVRLEIPNGIYLITGPGIFKREADSYGAGTPYQIVGKQAWLKWTTSNVTDELFFFDFFTYRNLVDGFRITVYNTPGAPAVPAGTVFRYNGVAGSLNATKTRFERLQVDVGGVLNKYKYLFRITGDTMCDQALVLDSTFNGFETAFYSETVDAVEWTFTQCGFVSGSGYAPTPSVYFHFKAMGDNFNVNSCSFSMCNTGETLLKTEIDGAISGSVAAPYYNFNFNDNRFEFQGASSIYFTDMAWGRINVRNSNLTCGISGQVEQIVLLRGGGTAAFDNVVFSLPTFVLPMYVAPYQVGAWDPVAIRLENCMYSTPDDPDGSGITSDTFYKVKLSDSTSTYDYTAKAVFASHRALVVNNIRKLNDVEFQSYVLSNTYYATHRDEKALYSSVKSTGSSQVRLPPYSTVSRVDLYNLPALTSAKIRIYWGPVASAIKTDVATPLGAQTKFNAFDGLATVFDKNWLNHKIYVCQVSALGVESVISQADMKVTYAPTPYEHMAVIKGSALANGDIITRVGGFHADGPVSVKWYGAQGDGTTDDTAAIQAAINSQTRDVCEIYLPEGTYKITSPLTFPATAKRVVVKGADQDRLTYDPYFKSKIWCKGVTGVTFDISGPGVDFAGFTFCGFMVDGTNGITSSYSTTWTGLVNARTAATGAWSCKITSVDAKGSSVRGAKGVDVSFCWWVEIQDTNITHMVNGYGLYGENSGGTSTTISVHKSNFRYNLECLRVGGSYPQLNLYDCSLESSLIACTGYIGSQVTFHGCWFENLGYNTVPGTLPISVQQGVGSPAVDSAFSFDSSRVTFNNCFFMYFATTQGIKSFFRGCGKVGYWESAGHAIFNHCSAGDIDSVPRAAPFFADTAVGGNPLRGTLGERFIYEVIDERAVCFYGAYVPDPTDPHAFRMLQAYADMRQVDIGRVVFKTVLGGVSSFAIAEVDGGLFRYKNVYSANDTRSTYPFGGQNVAGDAILVPQVGGSMGYVCSVSGAPGTWVALGAGGGGGGTTITKATVTGATYAVGADSYLEILVNFAGACTVTLPAGPTDGQRILVKDSSGLASVNVITVDGNGKMIDGIALAAIITNYGKIEMVYNTAQTAWFLI